MHDPESGVVRAADRASPRAVLLVLTGSHLGQRLVLDGGLKSVLIGRDPEADLVLTGPDVAWHHARVELCAEGWMLMRPGLPAGVRSTWKAERILVPDEKLAFGDTLVRFEVHDAIEQAFDQEVLERLNRDELTGLCSRRKFETDLLSAVEAASFTKTSLGVAIVDIDRLKAVNDLHGHPGGAAVIRRVGQLIEALSERRAAPHRRFRLRPGATPGAAFRPRMLACRLGGDEFALAFPATELSETRAVVESLVRRTAALSVDYRNVRLRVTLSGGVSMHPRHGRTPTELLRAADEALYRVKRAGGNAVGVATR